jgi:hypothetical protein
MEHNMKITEKEFNIITGEETITERDETAAEKESREIREAKRAEQKAEADAKALARKTVLDRLGLTDEEATILLG